MDVNSIVLMGGVSALLSNEPMRTVAEIRLDNLGTLIREARTVEALARAVDTSPIYLSQVRNRTLTRSGTPRGVGDALARRLEIATRKPIGWMDANHAAEPTSGYDVLMPPPSDDEIELVRAFRVLPQQMQRELREQLMADAARYIAYANEVLARQGATGIASNEKVANHLKPAPPVEIRPHGHTPLRRVRPQRKERKQS